MFNKTRLFRGSPLVCTMALCAAALVASSLRAQSATEPARSFEVASIKPDPNPRDYIGTHIDMGLVGSRYVATGVTAKDLIQFAYGVESFQVSGGPAWINSDKYSIDAKIDDASFASYQKLSREQQRQEEIFKSMMRSLLADRFHISVSHNTKELPAYALVVTKSGAKFTSAKDRSPASIGGNVHSGSSVDGEGNAMTAVETEVPISTFAKILSRQPELGGRIVEDKTALSGNYTFTLRWTRQLTEPNSGGTPDSAANASRPSLWTALEEQLGLQLKSIKAPVDTIVIDRIEKPTAN